MVRRAAVPITILLALVPLMLAAQGTPAQTSVTLQLTPKAVADGFPAQLAITVETSTDLKGAVLEIQPPPGFKADPGSIEFPESAKKAVLISSLTAGGKVRTTGEKLLIVNLRGSPQVGGARPRLASASLAFDYTREISVTHFLLLGSLGILIGYGLRLVLEILKSLPRPNPAPEDDTAGPITRFVKRNFFLVDLLVTLGLGFLALVALTKDGRPPANGAYWYTALTVGVGLGLLTNSELLTRTGGR